jgi:hypothetical protein
VRAECGVRAMAANCRPCGVRGVRTELGAFLLPVLVCRGVLKSGWFPPIISELAELLCSSHPEDVTEDIEVSRKCLPEDGAAPPAVVPVRAAPPPV